MEADEPVVDFDLLPHGHDETVLLVEDEPPMQEMVTLLLEKLGYRVTAATDGTEAMKLFRQGPARYAAILTDICLPGELSGLDVARQARTIEPGFPVCYMTGYPDAAAKFESRGEKGRCLIKPFQAEQLAEVVRNTIDGK